MDADEKKFDRIVGTYNRLIRVGGNTITLVLTA